VEKRVFVGLPLSDEAVRGVRRVMKRLERKHWKVRWEPESKWQVTVVFIGEVRNVQEVRKVQRVVRKVCGGMDEFELGFKGLGAFPDLLLPRVIWLGLNGDLKSLYRLVGEIRNQLASSGWEFENKAFRPHVTLGKVRRDCGRKERLSMGGEVAKMRRFDLEHRWVVDRVVVYMSVLRQGGLEYKVLNESRLRGG